uniref:Uncharacterized protein n=1 Tax=Lepeophtheirus salmonis TaxID=72036 RepID=A0A0K2VEJ5_LEPSM
MRRRLVIIRRYLREISVGESVVVMIRS